MSPSRTGETPVHELYLATEKYPDPTQYGHSQDVLKMVKDLGLSEKIRLYHVDDLEPHTEFFKIVLPRGSPQKLPLMVVVHEAEAIFGHSGLEEVTKVLQSPPFATKSRE